MGKEFLVSSIQSASYNIIFQVGFRVVTFLLNAFVLRNVSQYVIGVMNVRLLLLESTILFLSREAFRRALLSRTEEHNWRQVINLLWLTVPICLFISYLLGWVWLDVLETPGPHITTHYTLGVWCICISCVINVCVEPIYVYAQSRLFVKLRVGIETFSVTVRTIVFTSLVLWDPTSAVAAFSVAQIVATVCYAASYCLFFHVYFSRQREKLYKDGYPETNEHVFTSLREFLPGPPSNAWPYRFVNSYRVNPDHCKLVWSFFKQGILKQVLTEGERYVMTLFTVLTFDEQGVYDVVNNLGSLAARLLFRPTEESSYFYFSQMVSRDKSIAEQDKEKMKETAQVLEQITRGLISLGIIAVAFGQAYSRTVLLLYGGPSLANSVAVLLLRAHAFAILLLALNGILESYTLATMNTTQLDRYNMVMAKLSVGFLFISWLLATVLGSVGFIIANCCNMAARIYYSAHLIVKRYKGSGLNPLARVIPGKIFIFTAFISLVASLVSERIHFESHKMLHVFIGAVLLLLTLAAWAYEEAPLVRLGYDRLKRRTDKEAKEKQREQEKTKTTAKHQNETKKYENPNQNKTKED